MTTKDTTHTSSHLAILTFRLGGQVYGLPVIEVAQIVEMVTLTHLPQAPFAVQGVVNVHGKIVPILDLRLRFGLPFKSYQARTPIILVNLREQILGLIVDWVEEVVEISSANLETGDAILPASLAGLGPRSCLAGVAKVERRLILLLKVEAILSHTEQTQLVEQAGGDWHLADNRLSIVTPQPPRKFGHP